MHSEGIKAFGVLLDGRRKHTRLCGTRFWSVCGALQALVPRRPAVGARWKQLWVSVAWSYEIHCRCSMQCMISSDTAMTSPWSCGPEWRLSCQCLQASFCFWCCHGTSTHWPPMRLELDGGVCRAIFPLSCVAQGMAILGMSALAPLPSAGTSVVELSEKMRKKARLWEVALVDDPIFEEVPRWIG